jgi:hypothetical protein
VTGWKRLLLIAFGWGIGCAFGIGVLIGVWSWYASRPKPSKPWNNTAIKATYDTVFAEGDNNTLVVAYVLENVTNVDYKATDGSAIMLTGKLKRENSSSAYSNVDRIDYPVFIPMKHRGRVLIHLAYPYSVKEKSKETPDERKKYKEDLEQYMAKELPNLDGFVLFDSDYRYEIDFPGGWKTSPNP